MDNECFAMEEIAMVLKKSVEPAVEEITLVEVISILMKVVIIL